MEKSMKMRTKVEGDMTTVKVLVSHPMETGTRKDGETSEVIPAHFIKELKAEVNGRTVFKGSLGTGVSKNPYFAFKVNGATSGDTLKISWIDNLENSDVIEQAIK